VIGIIGAKSNCSTSDEIIGYWKGRELRQMTACKGCLLPDLNYPLLESADGQWGRPPTVAIGHPS
jgi:hypothetical protein